MKMTFDNYYAELDRLSKLEDLKVSSDYGLTKKDIDVMKKNPEKYVTFCMYMITRPWYAEDSDMVKDFVNADALAPLVVTQELDDIINEALELYDEE